VADLGGDYGFNEWVALCVSVYAGGGGGSSYLGCHGLLDNDDSRSILPRKSLTF